MKNIPPAFTKINNSLYVHKNSCNTYVFVKNGHALVIDPGDGRVFEHLSSLGAARLDIVIVTSHKRALCAGVQLAHRLYPQAAVLVPQNELHIFAQNDDYWQNKTLYSFGSRVQSQ